MRPYEVLEALWGLVGEGLVYLDSRGQSSPDNWAWRLSAQGITVAGGGAWQPRDPEGYLRRLERHRPAVNALTVEYVAEALRAFSARAFLAASVIVGVASERAVLDVAYTLVAVRGDKARKLREALTRNGASQLQRFTELRRALEPLKPT